MPSLYFWLMSEILFFYCLTAFVLCYFFRRFCQDPAIRKQLEAEEAEAAEAEAAEGNAKEGDADKTNLDNVATDDGADDEAPAKPNSTKKAEKPPKK